ncbi:MAG: iron export ABC transporter permease subunit FetB [Gemmatimonadetes bacterium]|uniref:Iron export ABC transporter permease subunit FetB n=1 Tax=Candidatus Kutchimonas denitrificans TaxID=3056748 RepID=A0AAE5C9C5_9BACT|nr:iron export ABC transporter permease subunit FetB [Gemmatimonadota bacterium]NIR75346.1 iron export ABC transporter permease subunit FetB [Candidatus Kutchimonas denitrificans]NIS00978.1 iron export ABC transporter permease subunit FetB [Gemmatimonadota bacterium]NIT66605.1 iron export ABC transporter permease subunit FetB [Gemmatimonadota bacterium]NIU53175.1 iron export ABC transporter permease subunit FetB [Gemmatimonadota bacterium]
MDILSSPVIDISWLDLVGAAGLILLSVGITRWQGTRLAGSFLLGGVRTVVQLTVVGYVLVYIFNVNQWYWVMAALLLMTVVATREAVGRQDSRPSILYGITGLSLAVGSGFTLFYVSAVVVQVEPWYNPRYTIPLFGMIVGNAMNAAALAAERLAAELSMRRGEVEAYLALGADSAEAAREPVRSALRAALIPTLNSLMVVGIVALPGMMTGQILGGVSPLTAIRYQIVVMFMLAGSVTLTATLVTIGYRRRFFTTAEQLRLRPE